MTCIFSKRGRRHDVSKLIVKSWPAIQAVKARSVSHAFKDIRDVKILNRFTVQFPVKRDTTHMQTDAIVRGINDRIHALAFQYEVVKEVLVFVSDIQLLRIRLEDWPEMHKLLKMTHTLTFRILKSARATDGTIDMLLKMHRGLKISIALGPGFLRVAHAADPSRVHVQHLVYDVEAFKGRLRNFSTRVDRVVPDVETRDGVNYSLSYVTGQYTDPVR